VTVRNEADEKNEQAGISAFYGKLWANGNRSNLTIGWSGLRKTVQELSEVNRSAGRQQGIYSNQEDNRNEISEFSGKLENHISLSESHTFNAGFGLYLNVAGFWQNSPQSSPVASNKNAYRWMGFLQDHVSKSV